MENNYKPSVVIAGAGPVGLFAAVLLIRAGQPVILLEKNNELPLDMRASTFHPSTLELLDACGLAEPLICRGSIRQGWQYMIHGTKEHAVFDLESISDATLFPFRLLCEQFHFSNLAVEELLRSPLFEIRFGHEILSLEDQPGHVSVTVREGAGDYHLETPWLIAADGKSSTVRRQLGLTLEDTAPEVRSVSLVLDAPLQDYIDGLLGVNFVWTEAGFYALRQVRDLWRLSWSPAPELADEEAIAEAALHDHLNALFPREESYNLLHCGIYRVTPGCLGSFRHGRVLFAGDAAHVESPSGGFGMNSGIHDAQCLAEHLVPVLQGADPEMLDRYSRRRGTVVREEVQRLSAREDRWRRETRPEQRRAVWTELLDVVGDAGKTREFLLSSSLIRARQLERRID